MGYLKNFNLFRKKNNLIDLEDVEIALDVVRGFADDNNLLEKIVFDTGESKEISFESTEGTIQTLYGINIRFYSDGLRFIILQDTYGGGYEDTYVEKNVKKMVDRIKKLLPDLKFISKSEDKLDIEIRKS